MNYSKQRAIVLDTIKASYDHPTAEEILIEAKKAHPKMGIATVYRNLNQLVEMGEVKRISMPDGQDRFDGHLEEHYHLVCTCCGRLQDLRPSENRMAELSKLANEVFGLKAGNKAHLAATVMEGICDGCRKKKKVV